jgi:hypothetical protein
VRNEATEVVVLIDQPNRKLRFDAAAGDREALADLIRSHGRGVRLVLAAHVDQWSAVEQLEASVWRSIRAGLTTSDELPVLLKSTARAAALTYLEDADRQAIQERDVLRRLVVQVALEDLRGQSSAVAPADQVQERLTLLPADQRNLLDLYYTRSVALQHLAAQRNVPIADLAHDACVARAACDWRTSAQAPGGDRLLPSLTEDLLSDTLDPDSRALLATSVAQDLGRSVRLERQVRLHLLLRALIGPFAQHEVQSIVTTALSQVDLARTQTASAIGSGRTRMRQSDVIRSPTSNRRPVSHPTKSNNQALLIAVVVGAGLLVLGVLLLPNRSKPPEKNSLTTVVAPTPATPERTAVSQATVAPPSAQLAPTPGASALRPQQLATPSVVPPLPAAELSATTPTTNDVTAANVPTTPVTSLEIVTLFNADKDQPIPGFEDLPRDVTIRLSQLPTKNINFEFHAPADIKSMTWKLPGCSLRQEGFEGARPFSLGNNGPDFHSWTPAPGTYTLTLSACSDHQGKTVVRTSTWRIRFEK